MKRSVDVPASGGEGLLGGALLRRYDRRTGALAENQRWRGESHAALAGDLPGLLVVNLYVDGGSTPHLGSNTLAQHPGSTRSADDSHDTNGPLVKKA